MTISKRAGLTYQNNGVIPGGTTNQVLAKASNTDYDLKWVTGGSGSSPLTTKGDIYTYSTGDDRLPVGLDNQVLTADSTQTTGLRWATVSSGSSAFTEVEINLGGSARTTGNFTIGGLSGLTTGKPVNIFQAVGPYTGKGTLADEAEMDNVSVKASVTAADTITAYWNADGYVKGNFKFNYLVGA
jgi:hypothetical protein